MTRAPWSANRLGFDYRAQAARLGPPPAPIVDAHAHIHGLESAAVYQEVRQCFGVSTTYTMSSITEVQPLRDLFGESIHFIATPEFSAPDRRRAFTSGFLESIEKFHALGSRVVKFWSAPRARDYAVEVGEPGLFDLEGPWRRRAMELGQSLGMMFMVHVGDPDTWFATKYADTKVYGSKRDQYIALERALDRFEAPWIAAHMGGWPEDLRFLDELLARHGNLHLDTSATKWMVRELSRHSRGELVGFLERWRGRVLFGSDIVTMDAHLRHSDDAMKASQASSRDEAFELYASRYWALRTLFETDYEGESPIADPDLMMVEPDRFDEMSAPALRGMALPADLLKVIYCDAATNLLERWRKEHP